MSSQLIRLGFILTVVALLVAGCAPTQAAPSAAVVAQPTDKPAAIAAAPTATAVPSPIQAPATNAGAGNDTIRFVLVPEKSEARFRVREQLANANLPNDAIGRTKEFTGALVI